MPIHRSFPLAATLLFALLPCQNAIARDLTLQDRIHAQEAIEVDRNYKLDSGVR